MRCPACQAENDDSVGACFECGASLGAIVKGSVIASRYEILKALGKGGMGMVYLAHDRQLEELVALKVLRSELAQSPDLAKRFRSEIKLARRVSHKNVCKIFEYGEDGSRQYIAMAYVDGVDLKKLLRDAGPFPPDEAFDIAIRVADALEAVHEEGIVHRDLKTPNIMKDTKGVVRLMDFGIAKDQAAGTAADLTGTGMIIGSPDYMSPEQWHGHKADARSDIYALGIVVYELFTARVPFHADTVPALMHLHLLEPPPLEGEAARLLPEPVRPVLARALAKEPRERFASAAEMAEALREARAACLRAGAPTPVPARTVPAYTARGGSALPQQHEIPLTEPMKTPVPTSAPTAVPTARIQHQERAPPSPARASMAVPLLRAEATPAQPAASGAAGRRRPIVLAGVGAGVAGLAIASLLLLRGSQRGTDSSPSGSTESPLAIPLARVPTIVPTATVPAHAPEPTPAAVAPSLTRPPPVPRSDAPPATTSDMGTLQVTAVPPAAITIDGRSVTGSLRKISLPAGTHVVRLEHADYQPIQRAVRIRTGEVTALEIDFAEDGVRRR